MVMRIFAGFPFRLKSRECQFASMTLMLGWDFWTVNDSASIRVMSSKEAREVYLSAKVTEPKYYFGRGEEVYRVIQAKVHKEAPHGTYFLVLVPGESLTGEMKKLTDTGILKGELRIDDGRHITAEQRKKAYATLGDIADHLGYPPEELKEIMKYRYVAATGDDYFSFADCSVTTARHFINHIIDFALGWDIPLMDTLLDRTDDINAAIYSSLKHRRCIVCGRDGEIHHWDPIGMGRDRTTVDDSHMRKLCLCRPHHDEAHYIGRDTFESKYHVYGIIFRE